MQKFRLSMQISRTLVPVVLTMGLGMTSASSHEHKEQLSQWTSFFAAAQVVGEPSIVDCTLSEGAKAKCFSITVRPLPATYKPGPWCPTNVSDGPDKGGLFFHSGKVVDVDGAFIKSLPETFNDPNWKLYDKATGKIRVTDTLEGCLSAARPNVAPEWQNYCVECSPDYVDADKTMTYMIPMTPVAAQKSQSISLQGSGVAHNGVRLDGPAPVEAILGAYTIAAFDDCGGHLNPHVGYHYHMVTDCVDKGKPETNADSNHGAPVGLAMDGHYIFKRETGNGTVPADLDACNGHATESVGYHYHAGENGGNAILGCMSAQVGCALSEAGEACDASKPKRRGPRQKKD